MIKDVPFLERVDYQTGTVAQPLGFRTKVTEWIEDLVGWCPLEEGGPSIVYRRDQGIDLDDLIHQTKWSLLSDDRALKEISARI